MNCDNIRVATETQEQSPQFKTPYWTCSVEFVYIRHQRQLMMDEGLLGLSHFTEGDLNNNPL